MALLTAYNTFLKRFPILGTSISAGGCYILGDFVAQKVEIKLGERKEIDYHRLGVFGFFGTLVAGPIYYAWFNKLHDMPQILEKIVKWNKKRLVGRELLREFERHASKGTLEAMSMRKFIPKHSQQLENAIVEKTTILVWKVLADQLFFSSTYPLIFMPGTYILLQNTKKEDLSYLMEHHHPNYSKIRTSFNESCENIKKKYFRIYASDWQFWPTAQMINFAFVQPHLQPVVTNMFNVGWNAYLCYVSQEKH